MADEDLNRTSSYVEAVAARAAEQAAAAAAILQNMQDDEAGGRKGTRDRHDSVVTTTSEVDGDGAAADIDDTPVVVLEMNPDPAANIPGFSEHLEELEQHKDEKSKDKEKEKEKDNHVSAAGTPDPGTPLPTAPSTSTADSAYVEHTQTLVEFSQAHKETHLNLASPQESKGLDEDEAARRLAINGPNQLTPPKRKPWIVVLLLQFTDPFLIMLIVAGVLALITFAIDSNYNNVYVGVALLLVVLITGVASFLQENKTARVMQLFTNLLPPSCIVIRGGNEYHTSAINLVVGDLVRVNGGDKMPADMRVLLSQNGKMEASALTGESLPIVCSNQPVAPTVSAAHSRCIVFSGSFCVEGSILAVVIRTGDHTFIGNIANLASGKQKKTLMQKELERFVKFISVLALIMASIAFAVGTGRHPDNVFNVFVYGFLVVIVANIPQGLPATVTSLLTITASRMASRNILVKRLDSIETLGSASLICTDKTGTLTQNIMTVVEVWVDMENHFDDFARMLDPMQSGSVTPNPALLLKYQKPGIGGGVGVGGGDDDDEPYRFKGQTVYSETFEFLHRIASVCNKATVEVVVEDLQPVGKDKHDRDFDHDNGHHNKDRDDEDEVKYRDDDAAEEARHRLSELDLGRVKEHVTGNASDIALYHFCNELRPVAVMRNAFPILFEIPFNSTNKWQLVITRDDHSKNIPTLSSNSQHYLMMKGAPEIVLTKCSNALIGGKEVPINDEFNFQFQKVYRKFASRGCRVLGFAHRYFDAEPDAVYSDELMNFPMSDLTFVGMVAIMDPPRPDVKAAIKKCHSAGIKVFMVTGDHQLTAEAIARDVGILGKRTRTSKYNVILGSDINKLSENDWRRIVNQDGAVFARTTPQQKLKIVKSCQALKQVVAVTGDGVNDAPALKHADIGVAMGISGNDVAREAANVVLLDDNFASVVVGIEQGRLIFDNLKKTIAYTLAHLMPEVIPVLLSLFFELPQALSAMQILSIDLATELGPAISLAYEPIERDIMKRRPRNVKKDQLVSRQLLVYSYCIIGLIETFGCFFSFFWVFASHGVGINELFFSAQKNWGSVDTVDTVCVGDRCFSPDDQDDIAFEAASGYYITMVVCQLCHLWSCKTRRISIFQHTLDNHVTYWGSALTFCLIIIFVYVPGLDEIMSSHAANAAPWIIGLVFGGVITLFNEYRKYLVRSKPTWRLTKELRW